MALKAVPRSNASRGVVLGMRLSRDAKPEREGALAAIAALHPLALSAAFELFSDGRGGELRLRSPGLAAAAVLRQQLASGYPGSRFEEIAPGEALPAITLNASFGMKLPAAVPLPSPSGPPGMRGGSANDAVNGLLSALDDVRPGEQASFQVLLQRPSATAVDGWALAFLREFEANKGRRRDRADDSFFGLFRSQPDPFAREAEARLAEAIQLKARLPLFDASVRLTASSSSRERTIELARNLLAPLGASAGTGLNALVPILDGSTATKAKRRRPALHPLRLSALEVLSLWHPPLSNAGPGRGCFVVGVDLPSPSLVREGVQLGWTAAGTEREPLRLPLDDLRRHAIYLGASGGGKSTSLLTLMLSLADLGHGFGAIDVKGDLVDDLLGRIPAHRRKDVHVIDPLDPECGAGIDLFGIARRLDLDLSADFVVSAFQAQFAESWGVAFPRPMKAAVRALLEVPGTSLLDLPRMLRDPDFRHEILAQVSDEPVRDYFQYEFEGQGRARQLQSIAPALTRIGAALDTAFGRRLFGSNAGPDLRGLMDSNGILVCRYHGGFLGKQNASLFAGITAAACQLAAMTRVDLPEQQRKAWTLVCDEAHDYATASFAETLSLGRGYGLSVVMATQFLSQMPAQVRSSMLANASTLVSFRLGEEDVSLVGRRFEPHVNRHELTDLSNFSGLVRTAFDGERQPPFVLHVRPPEVAWDAAVAAELRVKSRRTSPAVASKMADETVAPRPRLTVVPGGQVRWNDIEECEG